MSITYKIYQTNYNPKTKIGGYPKHKHDYFLELDGTRYTTLKKAEAALQKHLDLASAHDEFAILPIYTKK